jgi:hypothetical protein
MVIDEAIGYQASAIGKIRARAFAHNCELSLTAWDVLKQGMLLAGSGVLIGLLLSAAISKPVATIVSARGFNWPLVALVAIALLAMAAVGA